MSDEYRLLPSRVLPMFSLPMLSADDHTSVAPHYDELPEYNASLFCVIFQLSQGSSSESVTPGPGSDWYWYHGVVSFIRNISRSRHDPRTPAGLDLIGFVRRACVATHYICHMFNVQRSRRFTRTIRIFAITSACWLRMPGRRTFEDQCGATASLHDEGRCSTYGPLKLRPATPPWHCRELEQSLGNGVVLTTASGAAFVTDQGDYAYS
ncbi:uncharacterized protein ARMOST_02481 [Armillaria ostoyae]|uniref:Uncharacterized protein n=1 Tax=Armillaria ostoyae TaxID=47428 RepID=A0A284QS22_ARMOS|nr:uncharacterized protein ARMOST_02481 [Armillaria ostoyae]